MEIRSDGESACGGGGSHLRLRSHGHELVHGFTPYALAGTGVLVLLALATRRWASS